MEARGIEDWHSGYLSDVEGLEGGREVLIRDQSGDSLAR